MSKGSRSHASLPLASQAVGLVFDTVKEADMCGKRLVTEALTRGSNDNITALVTFLTPVTTLEKVFSEGKQVGVQQRFWFDSSLVNWLRIDLFETETG